MTKFHVSRKLGGKVVFLRSKAIKRRAWKTLNVVVVAMTLLNVSAMGMLIRPQSAQASGPASIWTTQVTCANPADQDANEYANGDHVYVRGKNFDLNTNYFGQIHGQPGNASSDPGQVVKEFTTTSDGNGYFCVDAYVVGSDGDLDDGVYTVDVWDNADHQGGSKNDNYHVNAQVGSLTVNKIVDTGSASPDSFVFEMTPDPYSVGQFSTTSGSKTFSNLPAGNYTVAEVSGPSVYHQVSNDCNDVGVTNGGQTTCTIHNTRNTRDVTIIKEVVGGNAEPSDWTFTLTATQEDQGGIYTDIVSGVPVTVQTGTFALSENGPSGYTMSVDGNCYNDGGFFLYTQTEGDNTCTVTNTYQPSQPSLTITKTDNHTTATPGETLTYEISVTNSGDTTANNVNVDDTLPAFLVTPTDISDSGIYGAGHIIWSNILVTGHTTKVVSFKAAVNSTMPFGTTVLTNVAILGCSSFSRLTSVEQVQCPWLGTATDTTSVTAKPVLGLTKEASPTNTSPLTTVTYTVKWSVGGNSQATGVVITDPIPANVNFISVADAGVYNATTKVITWDLGTKAAGTSGQVTWVGQVAANAPAGIIVNTASIDSNETDPIVTATANLTVVIPRVLGETTSPVLQLRKSVSKATVAPGDTVTYTVEIKNTGTGSAINLKLTDLLPAGFSFNGTTDTTKEWKLGDLAVGETKTVKYQVTVGKSVPNGSYENLAIAQADNHGKVTTTAPVNVKRPRVLGAAVDTGASFTDLGIAGLGLGLIILGFVLTRKRGQELA
jgi:uncharacterized repeat protein (TIGR01451 family)